MKYRIVQKGKLFQVESRYWFSSWSTVTFFKMDIGPYCSWFKTIEEAKTFIDNMKNQQYMKNNKKVVYEDG